MVKKALEALKLPGVSTVVGLQELRVDYRKYEERRKLRDGTYFCIVFRGRFLLAEGMLVTNDAQTCTTLNIRCGS